MESVHIFGSALDSHTKQRNMKSLNKQTRNFKKRAKLIARFPYKRWGLGDDPREALGQLKTVPRTPISRPQTTPYKLLREAKATVPRPSTSTEDVVNVTISLKHMGF